MPNHMHGILIINRSTDADDEIHNRRSRADARPAPTIGDVSGAFKSRCVDDNLKRIKKDNLYEIGKIWQGNYFEHIIRSDRELEEIIQYIRDNPIKWDEDENNPNNIKNANQKIQRKQKPLR